MLTHFCFEGLVKVPTLGLGDEIAEDKKAIKSLFDTFPFPPLVFTQGDEICRGDKKSHQGLERRSWPWQSGWHQGCLHHQAHHNHYHCYHEYTRSFLLNKMCVNQVLPVNTAGCYVPGGLYGYVVR